jgi:hypothetical protein
MTGAEYDAWRAREKSVASAQKILVGLFIASLAGFPAPLCGPIAATYAFKKRHDLAGAHGVYLAIGYGSAALGVVYLGTMLALVFGA